MKKLLILSLLFIIPLVSADVLINEIMYDSPEGTSYRWVELYNNGNETIEIVGSTVSGSWRLREYRFKNETKFKNNRRTFESGTWEIQPSNYIIIAKNKTAFLELYPNYDEVLIKSSAIGLNPSSTYPNVKLNLQLGTNDDEGWSEVQYNTSFGADGDGDSLQLVNNSWCPGDPTPGEANYCPPPPYFILNHPSHVLTDGTIFLIKAEIFGYEDGLYDIKIDIKDENGSRVGRIYDTKDEEWQSTSYYIYNALLVENEIGNYLAYLKIDPDKEYTGTATIQSKLRLSGRSSYIESDLYVFNVVDNIFLSEETNSSIQILDSPSKADFGNIVKVKINVYRGDTNKYAIYAYAEEDDGTDVSEKSSMHFKSKFTNYTLTVPIQLKFNCKEYYKREDYVIVVEGLGLRAEKEIELDGKSSNCEEKIFVESESSQESEEKAKEEMNETEESIRSEEKSSPSSAITGKTVYVSETSNKARTIVYLVLFISVILNIILLKASR